MSLEPNFEPGYVERIYDLKKRTVSFSVYLDKASEKKLPLKPSLPFYIQLFIFLFTSL